MECTPCGHTCCSTIGAQYTCPRNLDWCSWGNYGKKALRGTARNTELCDGASKPQRSFLEISSMGRGVDYGMYLVNNTTNKPDGITADFAQGHMAAQNIIQNLTQGFMELHVQMQRQSMMIQQLHQQLVFSAQQGYSNNGSLNSGKNTNNNNDNPNNSNRNNIVLLYLMSRNVHLRRPL